MHCLPQSEGDQPASHVGGEDGDPAAKFFPRARGPDGTLPTSRAGHQYLHVTWHAPKEESGISTAEATQGQQLVVPGQAHVPHVEGLPAAHVPSAVIPATRRSCVEVAASPTSPLDSAKWVYLRQGGTGKPLADSYQGPFRVLERGQKSFKVQLGERVDHVLRDRLEPHRAIRDPEPAIKGPPTSCGEWCHVWSSRLTCQRASL